eukprot:Blabericola_migrator_1__8271@NODE_4291_length_1239_cov_1_693686_g2651_i0_p1_GENE_NODE_4291_length_1239_cov_1_693686_g2651_i0NODE_4291_length_1239_cov_1_693686_g2651_i0_p1_ORF_typecomplete_len125_score3_92Enolase_like_N/PF18374_1/0_061_NODE_4291_length_1239_cov_1_693686_g2651_i0319693
MPWNCFLFSRANLATIVRQTDRGGEEGFFLSWPVLWRACHSQIVMWTSSTSSTPMRYVFLRGAVGWVEYSRLIEYDAIVIEFGRLSLLECLILRFALQSSAAFPTQRSSANLSPRQTNLRRWRC